MARGVLLEDLTWLEAEALLKPESVIVIPLGAACKEHGPHLKLNNDWQMCEYLKRKVVERADVVVAPSIPYFYYPSFVEYPGSATLQSDTAAALATDICRSLSRFGPRRFYVINTGLSSRKPLTSAAGTLSQEGILLHFTDFEKTIAPVVAEISQQDGGSHADEIETSIMLYIAPDKVDMTKAAQDFHTEGDGPLSRTKRPGTGYSPSGVWGDATLATADKGKRVVQSLLDGILCEIEELRQAELPSGASK